MRVNWNGLVNGGYYYIFDKEDSPKRMYKLQFERRFYVKSVSSMGEESIYRIRPPRIKHFITADPDEVEDDIEDDLNDDPDDNEYVDNNENFEFEEILANEDSHVVIDLTREQQEEIRERFRDIEKNVSLARYRKAVGRRKKTMRKRSRRKHRRTKRVR